MTTSLPAELPDDLLELFTDGGTYTLPRSLDSDGVSVSSMRLRAYWARLAALASGDKRRAADWLRAYNWAVQQETQQSRTAVFAQMV